MTGRAITPFWRDTRFWRIASQAIFLAALAAIVWYFLNNMQAALTRQRLGLSFRFLQSPASFAIGETFVDYNPSHPYARAFLVGLVNTLVVAVVGISLATPLGALIGIARLSDNWLVNKMAMVYVEVLRNTPLLVQMIFWYFAVFLQLPPVRQQIILPGPIYLNNRGVTIPWFDRGDTFAVWMALFLAAAAAAVLFYRRRTRKALETGQMTYPGPLALLAFGGAVAAAWLVLPNAPLSLDLPVLQGTNVNGGAQLTPEMAALIVALVAYTSAFIGEIVRAGIQSVNKGQVEAARALGVGRLHVLRLVIFPQALRVIIPPMTSQYLNLTKNSSLAVAIGYPDLFNVSTTIFNQTGRNVEVFVIVMLVYLTFSLVTSFLMNWYNRSVRLVER